MTDRLSAVGKGARGEAEAAAFLEGKGWTVLARNFRTRSGEIDLVARRGEEVVFVEVKSWRSVPREELGRSIGPRKQKRIVRAARQFLFRRQDLAGARLRFDVIFLGGEEGRVEHIPGAFTGEGMD